MTRRRALILLLVPLLVYAAICLALFLAQAKLLFPAHLVAPSGPPFGAEPLELTAPDGARLQGYHLAPARNEEGRTLVLGFGGNATHAARTAGLLHELYPAAHVVVFQYRGYAPSEGSPGAAAFVEDAVRIHDFARDRLRPARVIVAGFSVGGGVAAALVARRPANGLILVTSFDSLGSVAASHYPWLPVRWLFRHPLDPGRDLGQSRIPVAIVAAENDEVVPPARTDALRAAIPRLAFDRTIEGAGHNDIYDRPAFVTAMHQAIRSLGEEG